MVRSRNFWRMSLITGPEVYHHYYLYAVYHHYYYLAGVIVVNAFA